MAKTAILYSRVSTAEQATGYSLAGQLDELRDYADEQGYEVLEEVQDPGFSRGTLDRPGMDRVRERVAAGGVDAVIAWKRDRFGALPYPAILAEEFAEYGCKLRALDDSGEGDDAELLDNIKDAVAKSEIRKTAARARMGKLRKAREGKIIANSSADYGFSYNPARDGYEVDPETMPVVRRIFESAAEGESLYAIRTTLDRDGIQPPGTNNRSGMWDSTFLKKHIIEDDVYFAQPCEDIAALVSPDVAARLDPKKRYGIWWANRYEVKTKKRKDRLGAYKRRHVRRERPREEWIAVPVPDAGIPPERVEAARDALQGNRRFPSKAGGREWELSGGTARCGECGRAMTARRVASRGREYFYYGCQYAGHGGNCTNRKNVPAAKLETRVADFVSDLLGNEGRLMAEVDALIERERGAMRDPGPEAERWHSRLAEMVQERDGYIRLAAKGRISDTDLDGYLSDLDQETATIKERLTDLDDRRERIRQLEQDRAELASAYRKQAATGGLAQFTPEQRRDVYGRLRLVVFTYPDDKVAVEGDLPFAVSRLGSPAMVVADEDSSYLEEEGDGWTGEMQFYLWKSGPRTTHCASTCSPSRPPCGLTPGASARMKRDGA